MRHIYGLEGLTGDQNRKAREAYYACVEFLDESIGLLLRELETAGQLENTILVYISDHGDLIGNHGLWWKANWYEEACRVPFILSGPGIAKGVRRKELTGLIDLMPTLVELCGGKAPGDIDGVSLLPLVTKNANNGFKPHDTIITEFLGFTLINRDIMKSQRGAIHPSFRAIISDRCKYVETADTPGGRNFFFDLESDPAEFKNEINNPRYAQAIKEMAGSLNHPAGIEDYRAVLQADKERAEKHFRSNVKPSMPNQYRLKDGRMFDAELSLYGVRWLPVIQEGMAGYIPQKYH